MRMSGFLFAGPIVLSLTAGLAGPARAHGQAAWIMADPNTRHCCGPRDCSAVEVTVTTAGWTFEHPEDRGVLKFVSYDRDRGRYPSVDGQFWACLNLRLPGKPVRCIFVPEARI